MVIGALLVMIACASQYGRDVTDAASDRSIIDDLAHVPQPREDLESTPDLHGCLASVPRTHLYESFCPRGSRYDRCYYDDREVVDLGAY